LLIRLFCFSCGGEEAQLGLVVAELLGDLFGGGGVDDHLEQLGDREAVFLLDLVMVRRIEVWL
jgi:hypothetical protein